MLALKIIYILSNLLQQLKVRMVSVTFPSHTYRVQEVSSFRPNLQDH